MRSEVLDLKAFFALDYSQAELRILAEVSEDPLLIKQFQDAASDPGNPLKDVHCQVGHQLTGWSVEKIKKNPNARKVVKNMQFGIVFGKGRGGIYDYVVSRIREIDGENADLTGITRKFVEDSYDAYFKKYTGVARYMKTAQADGEEKGYVESIFEFRRAIFDDDARSTFTGNQSINTPIQSAAHTLLLIAMALIHMKPRTFNMLQTPVMEVHDALDFFVKVRDLPEAHKQGKHLLEVAVVEYTAKHFKRKLKVPLIAEAEAGFCLGSLSEYGGEPVEEWLPKWREHHVAAEKKSWAELEKV